MKRYSPEIVSEQMDDRLLAGHPNSIFSEAAYYDDARTAIHCLENMNARFAKEGSPADALLHLQLDDLMQKLELGPQQTLSMGY